jgi:hypothetical protein
MIGPFSRIGEGVAMVVRAIGRTFLFVGRMVETVVHSIGGAVRG